MKALLSLALMILAAQAVGQTTLPPGTYTVAACTTPPVTPPVTPPTTGAMPAGASPVYYQGKFSWISDYSWNGTVNYADTSGSPIDGSYDIAFTVTGPWGGWQPFDIPSGATGTNLGFNTAKYKTLHFCTKPTQPNQSHGIGVAANNDAADGPTPNISIAAGPNTTKYGPVPKVGVWGCYSVPIADLQLTNPLILKFSITDGTGLPTNLFYIDDVWWQ